MDRVVGRGDETSDRRTGDLMGQVASPLGISKYPKLQGKRLARRSLSEPSMKLLAALLFTQLIACSIGESPSNNDVGAQPDAPPIPDACTPRWQLTTGGAPGISVAGGAVVLAVTKNASTLTSLTELAGDFEIRVPFDALTSMLAKDGGASTSIRLWARPKSAPTTEVAAYVEDAFYDEIQGQGTNLVLREIHAVVTTAGGEDHFTQEATGSAGALLVSRRGDTLVAKTDAGTVTTQSTSLVPGVGGQAIEWGLTVSGTERSNPVTSWGLAGTLPEVTVTNVAGAGAADDFACDSITKTP